MAAEVMSSPNRTELSTTIQSVSSPVSTTTIPIRHLTSESADIILGILCLCAFSVGIIGNIAALIYFTSKRKDLPTLIYIVIASNDLLICITILPIAVSLINQRDYVLFQYTVVLVTWGVLWDILPYMSIFLISVLSITRTIKLLYPLKFINKSVVLAVIGVYELYLLLRTIIPFILGPKYKCYRYYGYCYRYSDEWHYFIIVTQMIESALPIIPITLSCCISMYVIILSLNVSEQNNSVTAMKRSATITILLVTSVYIIFNIPVFIIFCIHLHEVVTDTYTYISDNTYVWVIVYVINTSLNATINPIVYVSRMKMFRSSISRLIVTRQT